jgi:hypothetical protein
MTIVQTSKLTSGVIGAIVLLMLASFIVGCDTDPITGDPTKPETEDSSAAPLYGQSSVLVTPAGDTLRSESLTVSGYLVKDTTGSIPKRQLNITSRDKAKTIYLMMDNLLSPGKYPIDSLTYGAKVRIDNEWLEYADGWINVTQLDFDKHELSATYSIHFKGSKSSTEIYHATGVINRADLTTQEHNIPPNSTMDGIPLVTPAAYEKIPLKLLDLYTFSSDRKSMCKGKSYSTTRSLTIRIAEPKVGVFRRTGSMMRWNYLIEEASNDPDCNSTTTIEATANDSVVVTEFDPVARHISGWYTIEGKRADFKFTCWIREHAF